MLNPLADERWGDFLDRHPRSSVFHSRGWLDALKRTYGYDPMVLTTTQQGPLSNGLVLCHVRAWGSRRLVSLPFSDHCDVLADSPDELSAFLQYLFDRSAQLRWSSIELRARSLASSRLIEGAGYYLHTVDLARPGTEVFDDFHHSTQRAIRRAARDGLRYESGTSESLLSAFYGLLRQARRRHGLPPQPLRWFRHLMACLTDALTIHLASKDRTPVASMLTLSYKNVMVYKYGGSDERYHRHGAMPFLFWNAIQHAQQHGIEKLDLGRSDIDQVGLIAFKERLGGTRSKLVYYTWPARRHRSGVTARLAPAVRWLVGRLPDPVLDFTGRLLYRYVG